MKSFVAALRNLVLPWGRTTGPRIVLNGDTGRIEVYDAANDLVYYIDASIPGAIAGPPGVPQVKVYSTGVNGVVEFPTNDPNEVQPARLASVVYNQGTPTERLAVELQGPSHDVDSDRLALVLNAALADGSVPANFRVFDIASQNLMLFIDENRVQVNEALQVTPDNGDTLNPFFLNANPPAATSLVVVQRNSVDRFLVTYDGRIRVTPESSVDSAIFVNAAAGYTGFLERLQLNGADRFTVSPAGNVACVGSITAANLYSGTAQTPAPGGAPAQTSVAVNFPAAMPAVPVVVLTPNSAAANLNTSNIRGAVTNKTVNGFTINCWRDTNAATNWEWVAYI